MYKLRSWIDDSTLTNHLSVNINAVEYLENHPEKICYSIILFNINAIHIIEKNLDKVPMWYLSSNPNLINLLRNNRPLINYGDMCRRPHGIEFMEKSIKNNKLDKIEWHNLSYNSAAIHILEQYPEKINWYPIIFNKNAEHMIRNNLDKVEGYWHAICAQPHLICLIEKYPEKINWSGLSGNYNAIHLLKNNLNNIDIHTLIFNKNGFELLRTLNHNFDNNTRYHKNIIYAYWNYCKSHNIEFSLTRQLCEYGYTDEHFEFIRSHPINYKYLSRNPHIFIYDYERMKKTRQQQPWYRNIKNEFI